MRCKSFSMQAGCLLISPLAACAAALNPCGMHAMLWTDVVQHPQGTAAESVCWQRVAGATCMLALEASSDVHLLAQRTAATIVVHFFALLVCTRTSWHPMSEPSCHPAPPLGPWYERTLHASMAISMTNCGLLV